jgi:hypothetical protein
MLSLMTFKERYDMPLSGGDADKVGNRYEVLWTVACMAEVMEERAESIRLEPPGKEGEGAEFWLRKGDITEYHQVKRQYGRYGRWNLAELEAKPRKVLSHFFDKLNDSDAWCVFVSTQAAYQLDELSNRARGSTCFEEFDQVFLKDDKNSKVFNDLCDRWNVPDNKTEAYEALKRIRVETVSENFLRTTVESHLTALVDGNPADVKDILAQFALHKVHQELIALNIWNHLETRGYRPRQWGKDPRVLEAIKAQNDRYLSPLRNEVIAGVTILRDEVESILDDLVSSDNNKGVLISGEAGVGKSNVILQVVEALHDQGWPVLAFRVDRLNHTQLPDDVGSQLGLPGSPANVLASVSQGQDCVLVIDQLDAVSLASGRNPSFFDCIHEIINQTQTHPKMRLLLACRKFDIDNDHRLRRLTDKQGAVDVVPIKPLLHETVRGVVDDLGLDSRRLNTKQLDLLSVPLHLRLLSEISENTTIDALNFGTARDLYREYWSYKQAVIRERLGRPFQWTRVINTLCDYMSDRQVLHAPEDIIDEYLDDAKAMASEHVLILDNKNYAFFHEGFFDYAFARRFATSGNDLLSLLISSEQHLFRRAQVRQILLHEREIDFDNYIQDLNALLTCSNIRFHLKKVVFSLLEELTDPREEEWKVIADFIDNSEDPRSREVQRILYGSVPWFNLLDSLGLIEKWLADRDKTFVIRARDLLISVQKKLSNRVSELIEPYIGVSEEWNGRLAYLMQFSDFGAGRRFFELTLKLIDKGILDKVGTENPISDNFWFSGRHINLPENHPDSACELIGHYLKRRLTLTLAAGRFNPFDQNEDSYGDTLKRALLTSAKGAPAEFVAQVLPFMLHVIGFTAESEEHPPYHDSVWIYHDYDWVADAKEAILVAMVSALSDLAVNKPEYFEYIAEQLKDLDFKTVQYLLIRSYAANGEKFVADATDYLCAQITRLETGYISSSHWATRQLLESITPHCSDFQLSRLESAILNYYSEWEQSEEGSYSRGHAQFVLLGGFDSSRRSEPVSRRLEELAQKFGSWPSDPQERVRGGIVRSPISESEADKMTDGEWIEAVARYNYTHRDHKGSEDHDFLVGGAHELSGVLENQAKKDPTRFAELVQRFPDETHKYYFEAILRGISDVGLDVRTVLRACQRCHRLPDHPCGRWICQPIARLAEKPLPNEALDIVAWYATEDPNPEQELWHTKASGGACYYGGDISGAGLNSVRGAAANCIGTLIYYDTDRIGYFLPTLEQMVQDPSIAVRSWIVTTLTALLKHDRDLAVQLFQQLCETEDVLLGTYHVERFLKYALQTHFDSLKPILERMLSSEVPEAVRIGARQACLASLYLEEAKPLADLCLSGTETQRLSSAEVFALNLREYRPLCEDKLIQLFDDPDDKVRVEATKCFNQFEGDELGEYVGLIETFVKSSAFDITRSSLIDALEKTTAKLPNITCQVCERYLDAAGSHSSYERHAWSDINVSQLILRIYRQTEDEKLIARCLDLIDRIMQIESYGLDRGLNEELSLYDR